MRDVLVDVAALNREVNGAGDGRRSIRRRLHDLEGERQARRLLADQAADQRTERFTRREKLAGLVLSALVLVPTYVDLYLRTRG
jgi:hypothetical protein